MLTPPDTRADQRRAAVLSLARIRAVEAPPGEDGLKAVWHRCAAGADLLSYVDVQGRLWRQEFTLLDDFFVWTEEEGLCTGEVRPEPAHAGGRPVVATVTFDGVPVPMRILRADAALAEYAGQDRFLLHVREVVRRARPGAHALVAGAAAQVPVSDGPAVRWARRLPLALLALAAVGAGLALAVWGR